MNETTIFTREFIASEKYILKQHEDKHSWNDYLSLEAINEIERLQNLVLMYQQQFEESV